MWLLVAVSARHAEPLDRVSLEVELDEDGGLVADHPTVVPRLDGDDLRRLALDVQPSVYSTWKRRAGADVRVHAQSVPTTGFMSTDQRKPTG